MKQVPIILLTLLALTACTDRSKERLEERIERISKAEMESVAELLGHNLFEGRAPGTRGGQS